MRNQCLPLELWGMVTLKRASSLNWLPCRIQSLYTNPNENTWGPKNFSVTTESFLTFNLVTVQNLVTVDQSIPQNWERWVGGRS